MAHKFNWIVPKKKGRPKVCADLTISTIMQKKTNRRSFSFNLRNEARSFFQEHEYMKIGFEGRNIIGFSPVDEEESGHKIVHSNGTRCYVRIDESLIKEAYGKSTIPAGNFNLHRDGNVFLCDFEGDKIC